VPTPILPLSWFGVVLVKSISVPGEKATYEIQRVCNGIVEELFRELSKLRKRTKRSISRLAGIMGAISRNHLTRIVASWKINQKACVFLGETKGATRYCAAAVVLAICIGGPATADGLKQWGTLSESSAHHPALMFGLNTSPCQKWKSPGIFASERQLSVGGRLWHCRESASGWRENVTV
jgi:hypothetical protein